MSLKFTQENSYDKEKLLLCSRGGLFGNENGKLPNNEMLMIDRISKINSYDGDFENVYLVGELDINPKLWFFGCHFTGDPVMPGCLGKFFGPVLPKAKIVKYEISIKRIRKQKLVVGFADGKMFVDDKEIYTAKNLRVGLFKDPSSF